MLQKVEKVYVPGWRIHKSSLKPKLTTTPEIMQFEESA